MMLLFLFFINALYFLVPPVFEQIFNLIAELVFPTKEAKA